MKTYKKIVISIVTIALIFSVLPLEINNVAKASETEYGLSNPRIEDSVSTWDCMYFGNYYQSNSETKEPIKWRVLSINGDDAFLLADKSLYYDFYKHSWQDVNWETCDIRNWLNDTFYNNAFSDEEKQAIKETNVINKENPIYGTIGGNNTSDKVYLLSINEATNADYGFATGYTNSETRVAIGTDSYGAGRGDWWLRSPGSQSPLPDESAIGAAYVKSSGYIQCSGDEAMCSHGIRPVLHLDLSSNLWTKAEPVSCKNLPEEQATPTPTPTNTPKPTTKPTANPTQKPAPTQSTTMAPTQAPKTTVTPSPRQTVKPQTVTAPGKVKKLKVKNKKKRSVVLSWKKVKGAKGYKIQYVKQDGFGDKKSIYTKKTKYTVKKLRKKKTYPFRVQAYKINGKQKVYGKWSAVKRVKIKK